MSIFLNEILSCSFSLVDIADFLSLFLFRLPCIYIRFRDLSRIKLQLVILNSFYFVCPLLNLTNLNDTFLEDLFVLLMMIRVRMTKNESRNGHYLGIINGENSTHFAAVKFIPCISFSP